MGDADGGRLRDCWAMDVCPRPTVPAISGPSFHSLVQRTLGSMMKLNWGNFAASRRLSFAGSGPSAPAPAPSADDDDDDGNGDDDDGCHRQSSYIHPQPGCESGVLLFLGCFQYSSCTGCHILYIHKHARIYVYILRYSVP